MNETSLSGERLIQEMKKVEDQRKKFIEKNKKSPMTKILKNYLSPLHFNWGDDLDELL